MFKNFLTYNMALSFERACGELGLPAPVQERLMRSCAQMFQQFKESIETDDVKREARALCAAVLNLRDARDIIESVDAWTPELRGQLNVLHGRMEQLCLMAADADGDQLRMLG